MADVFWDGQYWHDLNSGARVQAKAGDKNYDIYNQDWDQQPRALTTEDLKGKTTQPSSQGDWNPNDPVPANFQTPRGWDEKNWGPYWGYQDQTQAYKTDQTKIPNIQDFIAKQNIDYVNSSNAGTGTTELYGRPWNSDPQIAHQKAYIDQQYQNAVADYNKMYGTNIQPDQSMLGPNVGNSARQLDGTGEPFMMANPFADDLKTAGLGIGTVLTAGAASGAFGGAANVTASGGALGEAGAGSGLTAVGSGAQVLPSAVGSYSASWPAGMSAADITAAEAAGLTPQILAGASDVVASGGVGLSGANITGAAGLSGGVAGTAGAGADLIGSDFATGQPTGPVGGTLQQTAGGLTAANQAAGIPNTFSNMLDKFLGQGGPQQLVGSGLTVPPGTGTALSRIFANDGTATTQDWLSTLGTLGSTGLGLYASNQQSNAASNLADKYAAYGDPSRKRYEASFQPGFNIGTADPAFAALKDQTQTGLLSKLSATGGNPYGNPGGLIEANKQIGASLDAPWLQNYRNQNAATGGYNAFNTAAPGAATAANQQSGNVYNALGSGLSAVLNPTPTLQQQLAQLQNSGLKFTVT